MTLGYQGFGNLGDEAILAGIEQLLAGTSLEVMTVASGDHAVPAFPDAERVPMHGLLPGIAALRALRRRDALVVAGGGLLHDHWPVVIPSYLVWTLAARASGARVVWLGVGIGPIRHAWSRRLTGLVLRLASLVTVRDAASRLLARSVAASVRVTEIPDPAIFNVPPEPADREGIGIIVRGPAPSERGRGDELARGLGALAGALSAARQRPVVLLTLGGAADRAIATTAAEHARRSGIAPTIEELAPDPAAGLRRIGQLEAVVSVRLHGVILAALAGTPVVGVSYDRKVASYCDLLAVPVTDLDGLQPERVTRLLEKAESPGGRERVAVRVRGLRGRAEEVRGLLRSVLA